MRGRRPAQLALAACAVALAAPAIATAQLPGASGPPAQPYGENDFGGFRNILPPGSNGLANATDLARFFSRCPPGGSSNCPDAPRPPHNNDQLFLYGDLVYAAPGLSAADLDRYFKDASFGVKPEDVERTYSPRSDVTIVRDRGFGVPHIYGQTRAGAMFGAGYVAAEDRLFFIDILRHVGRAQLSSFAGGAEGNRDLDRDQWANAPYTEEDLQRQVDQGDDLYGEEGRQGQEDVANYVAGVNQYISEARLNPLKMPGEYGAINRPRGPDDWKATDVVAIAALVGAIFGRGGGGELTSALALQEAQARFGRRAGTRVWQDFRSAEDPESPTSVTGRSFPYQVPPRRPARGSVAIPDRGSLRRSNVVASSKGGESSSRGILDGLLSTPRRSSNALLVSARESATGRPLAVFGPQTGYFSPQILMEMDIHAPGIDARGVSFPGTNLYVQLGRGRDYAWSATSAGQDNIDTFAVELCEPGGGAPSLESAHYLFRGQCLPFEVLERRNQWTPNAADQTPPGSETLRAERSKLGIVTARGRLRGKPVAYTRLRSTYFHEVDSARGIARFNEPDRIRNARDFQEAASLVGYTFNWYYADDRDIAYFNSGDNPVRARGVDPNFPVHSRFEWRGYDPDRMTAAYTPFREHPQAINQSTHTDWNNKQARGYRAADDNFSFTSVFRVKRLRDRVIRGTRGRRRMTLPQLVGAMEDAGTVDLRGDAVLPWALRVIGRPRNAALRIAVRQLRDWQRDGAHRRDRDRNGVYEHTDAIKIMDAWWPLLVEAQFKPVLGEQLYERIKSIIGLDNAPNNKGDHLGSAYQAGWYGYSAKDLRAVLGVRVRGRYSRKYCGRGNLRACRKLLSDTLLRAVAADRRRLYEDRLCTQQDRPGDQLCFDSVFHRPLGGISQPLIHWIDRPTFQQVVSVEGHRPR